MLLNNKKGAALLQVLLVTAVLAGMATMLLRVSLSRTTSARTTRRVVEGQSLINDCQEQVNLLWSAKNSTAYARDLNDCCMSCSEVANDASVSCSSTKCVKTFQCNNLEGNDGNKYSVEATMEGTSGQCKVSYKIINSANL